MAARGPRRGAATGCSLPSLLSQVLVAYTIEFDSEFERQVPHRTTDGGGPAHRPWLVSLVMYVNFMRFVPDQGITLREFCLRSGLEKKILRDRVKRMARWWGYVTLYPPAGGKAAPAADWTIRPSAGGLRALQIWRPLFGIVEERWRRRFGNDTIDALRDSLSAVVDKLEIGLPEYLPILNVVWAGWFAEAPLPRHHPMPSGDESTPAPLSALLSRTLFSFALDFERESDLSVAIGSNLLRVLNGTGVPLRDLQRLTGVSREAIEMMLGFLTKHRFLVVEADSAAARVKLVRLTSKGIEAQHAFGLRLSATEKDWQKLFGVGALRRLRSALETLAVDAHGGPSPLMQCFALYPEGWRASRPLPDTLPHYPMVLHRGGFPDGS